MRTKEDLFFFIKDLLAETEIIEFAQRLDIVKRLYQKQSYKKIETDTRVSSITIARVANFFNGKNGGYRKALGA